MASAMRILVAGAQGQVAQSLSELAPVSSHALTCIGRPDLDLTDETKVHAVVQDLSPDLVINAAAYTAVDLAETERDEAYRINAEGAGHLSRAAAQIDSPILHLSTDYVFDGSKPISYVETDPVAPLGVYGASKLAGEDSVAEGNPKHFIFRTAWVYSPYGKNFVKTMLRLAADRDEVSVVDDQIGSPTSALDIASALLAVAERRNEAPDTAAPGLYHLAGTGIASWADVAEAIFQASAINNGPSARVKRIESKDFPTPTKRPENSRLNCNKLRDTFGISLPNWETSIYACVQRLLS